MRNKGINNGLRIVAAGMPSSESVFRSTIFMVLTINCLTALRTRAYQGPLQQDETGRYIYQDRKNPALQRICTYCPYLSLTSDEHNKRDQQPVCIHKNHQIWQHDREENSTLSLPFCKQNVGRRPGCGNLTIYPFQESWIEIGLNGTEEELKESIKSVVYHVYIPVCQTGYTLINSNAYRCGENRRWNASDPVRCVIEDPTASQVDDIEDVSYEVIVSVVVLALGIAFALLVLFVVYRKQKLNCGKSRQKESTIEVPLSVCTKPPPSSVADSLETNTTDLDDKERPVCPRRNGDKDYTSDKTTNSPLLPSVNLERGGQVIVPQNADKVTVFGACRIPHLDTDMPCYQVFVGCEIYIITRIRLKRPRSFIVYPPRSCSVNSRLVRQYNFCYAINGVSSVDDGIYQWEIIDSKKKVFSGSFKILVLQGYDRPDPIGCSSNQHIMEIGDERVDTVSVTGSAVSVGVCATPLYSSSEKSLNLRSEPDLEECTANEQLYELGPNMTCTKSLEEVWDDQDLNEVIQNLCYLLDPLGGAPRNKRWPGLARWYLGDKMTRPYIRSIEYHKKGDPDDGPTLFLLNSLCSQGCYLGHIVWYFSRSENLYEEVVDLLANCHTCTYCEEIRNSGKQTKLI